MKKSSILLKFSTLINEDSFSKILFYLSCLFFVLLGFTFFYFGNMNYWDAVGHLDSARFINETTFPDYTGFNAKYLMGFQQNLFYSPLFHYLAAIIMLFFNAEISAKLFVTILFIFFPVTIYYFSKKIMPNLNEARFLSVIIMAFWVMIDNLADYSIGAPGIGSHSTFQIGLFPAFLVAPLTFIFLGVLIDVINGKKSWKIAAILLSLIELSHFSGFGIALLTLFYIFIEKNKRITLIKILITSLILTAFWWIPFIVYYFSIPQAFYPASIQETFIFLVLISFVLSLVQKNNLIKTISTFCFALLLLWMYTKYFQIPFQFFRLQPLIILFIIIPIYNFFLQKKLNYLKKSVVVIFFIILFIGFFNQIKISSINNFEIYSIENYDGRILFLQQSDSYFEFHNTYIDSINKVNGLTANGLFVESTKTSELTCAVLAYFDSYFKCWGVPMFKREKYGVGVYEKQLNVMGINWVVGEDKIKKVVSKQPKEVFLKRTTTVYDKSFFFIPTSKYEIEKIKYIYKVNDTNLIEIPSVVVSKSVKSEKEWRDFVNEWFFNNDLNVYLKSYNPNNFLYSFEKKKDYNLNYSFSKNYSEIKINVDSETEVPILIKFNYDARWSAHLKNGEKIPIYVASPYSMVVIGKGEITLKNQPNSNLVDIIARLISVIGAGYLVIRYILKKKQNINKLN